jgi:hypothetical protein
MTGPQVVQNHGVISGKCQGFRSMAKSVERLNLTGVRGNTIDVTFCEQPEELIKFAHSLAVSNGYQVYKEALGDPPESDVEMQQCRLARDRIVHDFELISQTDRDKHLQVIGNRLRSAGLIN